MSVLVVDYGVSNLGSVRRALEECGASARVSDDPRAIETAARIVLPGVGSFSDGMLNLRTRGWIAPLEKAAGQDNIPLLGICLGMQLLADRGLEGGNVAGLGFVPGEVHRLEPGASGDRIPHVGWNEVHHGERGGLFAGIPDGSDFYFVHSYHLVPNDRNHVLATTPYCERIVSAVRVGNVFGVQFHPEKSGRPGFQVLRNFLAA